MRALAAALGSFLLLLCGGSGLYLRALMQGFSAIPAVPAEVRDKANSDWQAMGAEAFRARLADRDPAIVAKLKPGDRQRHVRAWEVLVGSGRPRKGGDDLAPRRRRGEAS